MWITTNWKILKEIGIPNHLTCLLRNLCSGQEATELDMEQQTGSKSRKEYVKAIYCHLAYLTSMQSASWDLLKEVAIILITPTVVWSQVKQQGGNTAPPINRKLDLRLTEHGPSEQDPVSPSVSLSHQEASKAFILNSSEGRQTENHNHRKLTKLIT